MSGKDDKVYERFFYNIFNRHYNVHCDLLSHIWVCIPSTTTLAQRHIQPSWFAIFAAWSASAYALLLWMARDVLSFTGELPDGIVICRANGTRCVGASS